MRLQQIWSFHELISAQVDANFPFVRYFSVHSIEQNNLNSHHTIVNICSVARITFITPLFNLKTSSTHVFQRSPSAIPDLWTSVTNPLHSVLRYLYATLFNLLLTLGSCYSTLPYELAGSHLQGRCRHWVCHPSSVRFRFICFCV